MAHGAALGRKSDVFRDRLDKVRSMMQTLLQDAIVEYHPIKIDPKKGVDYFEVIEKYETELILTALELTGGRQKDAAKLLNLATSTLSVKMKRLNLR